MDRVAAVILAGGLSSRMGGGDKPLLEINGKPLLEHIIARLNPQASPIAINANGDPARFQPPGLPVIADIAPGHPGPLAGVHAGLVWARRAGASRLVTVAGDTPFFPMNLVAMLDSAAEAGRIAVAASADNIHPTFALWPVSLADDLAAFLADGGRKVVTFIERHPHVPVAFPAVQLPGGACDPFFNINSPGDLAEARRLMNS